MGFLFPLFLIAALGIAIPILIHLFNLRKYKKMNFPSLRFLNNIVIQNKKMSKIQRKWLLLARVAFIIMLVLAFAQPFFTNSNTFKNGDGITVIYIDNSMSMEYKIGQQELLDKAKQAASQWIQDQTGDQFYLISNDNMYHAQSLHKVDAIQAINKLQLSTATTTADQLENALINLKEQLHQAKLQVIAFSDFQRSTWITNNQDKDAGSAIYYVLYPIQHDEEDTVKNIYIDTAYFAEAPVDALQQIPLVTSIRKIGTGTENTTLTTKINGLSTHTKNITLQDFDSVLWDTTFIQISGGKWHHITQEISARSLSFDDKYHLSAEIAPAMNVLIYNQQQNNAYISNAFAAQQGIHPLQYTWNETGPDDANLAQSLIILQGITSISPDQAHWIKKQLENGKSIAITFGKGLNIAQFNESFKDIAPITISNIDTSFQQIVDLQSTHPLLQGVLAEIPNNVQLPFAHYSYHIKAGITAGAQDVMRFRSGAPFISQYNILNAKLYLFASPLIPDATNLISSHYFAPIMYKMALNSSTGNVLSAEIAPNAQFYIQRNTQDENKLFRLYNESIDLIPKQQARGIGTSILIPESLPADGFYTIAQQEKSKQYDIGLNYNRQESDISRSSTEELLNKFGKSSTTIINNLQQLQQFTQAGSTFPLWKIALILALILLCVETYLLRKQIG